METPARRQYLDLKARHPDAIVWFRMGDFYETFDADAEVMARDLHITLTSREFGRGNRVPMAGVPHHAATSYLRRLLAKGHRVAICEQLSEAGKGLVERDVVRVLTPGTVVEPNLLAARENNYLVALLPGRDGYGLSYVDLSTGEFCVSQFRLEQEAALLSELNRLDPAECLLPEGKQPPEPLSCPQTPCPPRWFRQPGARERLHEHFHVVSLEAFGCAALPLAVGAAGALLAYIESADRDLARALRPPRTVPPDAHMTLDLVTRRNLDLTRRDRAGNRTGTLLHLLDQTRTPVGGRLLRRWLAAPLLDLGELERRQAVVAALVADPALRGRLQTALDSAGDLERVASRARQGSASARDLLALAAGLRAAARVRDLLAGANDARREPDDRPAGAAAEPIDSLAGDLPDEPNSAADIGPDPLLPDDRAPGGLTGATAREWRRPLTGGRLAQPSDACGDGWRASPAVNGRDPSLAAGDPLSRPPANAEDDPSSAAALAAQGAAGTGGGNTPTADPADPPDGQPTGKDAALDALCAGIDPLAATAALIEQAVDGEGDRRIRAGFDAELDAIGETVAGAQATLLCLEQRLRQETGIRSLKVAFNKVFGYYIEVTRANLSHVPASFLRRQTLANAERFVTDELRECEAAILRAEERIAGLEEGVFAAVREQVGNEIAGLLATAAALAELDVLAAFAAVAAARRYTRPLLDHSGDLLIEGGRHPVVEAALEDGAFIANDTRLSMALANEVCEDTATPDARVEDAARLLLITGPNMAGKSTYLRQVALIVLMAQVGSFVPAVSARIGLVDRIFTRVGAHDDLAAGESTFLVEMVETAAILRQATARSLLIFDEIGRGTSTFDGLSIARAVVEDVHDRIGARTLFATHYHELTSLAARLPALRNANAAAVEDGGRVVFLHRIRPGGADRSYGIHVAAIAGLPEHVTARARALLAELERPAPASAVRRIAESGAGYVASDCARGLLPNESSGPVADAVATAGVPTAGLPALVNDDGGPIAEDERRRLDARATLNAAIALADPTVAGQARYTAARPASCSVSAAPPEAINEQRAPALTATAPRRASRRDASVQDQVASVATLTEAAHEARTAQHMPSEQAEVHDNLTLPSFIKSSAQNEPRTRGENGVDGPRPRAEPGSAGWLAQADQRQPEQKAPAREARAPESKPVEAATRAAGTQPSAGGATMLARLRDLDLARMTPLAALNTLAALQEQASAAAMPPEPLRLVTPVAEEPPASCRAAPQP